MPGHQSDQPTVRAAPNHTPRPPDQAAGPRVPRSRALRGGARAQVAGPAAPVGQPRARGGASRVPFKRPHHPPLTSVCLSAGARVPRCSAPTAPRRHDERRPGARRAARPCCCARRSLLPTPADARAAPSSTMSVAGLKKQFHKATQVRRGQVRGGAGRSRAEPRGARWALPASGGSVGPRSPGCARIARPAAAASGSGSPPSVPLLRLGAELRAPVSVWRPASALPSAGTTGRGTGCTIAPARRCLAVGDYVKSPISPVTLRCRCPRRSWDVLARTAAGAQGGCGDVRGRCSSPVSESALPRSVFRRLRGMRGLGCLLEAHASTFPWGTWWSNSLQAKA